MRPRSSNWPGDGFPITYRPRPRGDRWPYRHFRSLASRARPLGPARRVPLHLPRQVARVVPRTNWLAADCGGRWPGPLGSCPRPWPPGPRIQRAQHVQPVSRAPTENWDGPLTRRRPVAHGQVRDIRVRGEPLRFESIWHAAPDASVVQPVGAGSCCCCDTVVNVEDRLVQNPGQSRRRRPARCWARRQVAPERSYRPPAARQATRPRARRRLERTNLTRAPSARWVAWWEPREVRRVTFHGRVQPERRSDRQGPSTARPRPPAPASCSVQRPT